LSTKNLFESAEFRLTTLGKEAAQKGYSKMKRSGLSFGLFSFLHSLASKVDFLASKARNMKARGRARSEAERVAGKLEEAPALKGRNNKPQNAGIFALQAFENRFHAACRGDGPCCVTR
jgi:hypothetical protein